MGQVNLKEIMLEDLVVLDHAPFGDKQESFAFAADLFAKAGCVSDPEKYIVSLNYRETLGSTYMGNFLAIPHGKCDEVTKAAIAFLRCTKPFIYQSADEEGEVKYIFALAVAGQQVGDGHLKILAELAGYLANDNFIELLDSAQNYKDIIDGLDKIKKEMEEEI